MAPAAASAHREVAGQVERPRKLGFARRCLSTGCAELPKQQHGYVTRYTDAKADRLVRTFPPT